MNRFTPDPTVSGKSSAICDHGTPSSGHGSRATTVVKCRTDDEVISAMCDNVPKHDFVFGRLMELADVQGCELISVGSDAASDLSQGTASQNTLHPFHPSPTVLQHLLQTAVLSR